MSNIKYAIAKIIVKISTFLASRINYDAGLTDVLGNFFNMHSMQI
jgi:hypothetical protein